VATTTAHSTGPDPDGTEYHKRPEFLIAMYNQLMGDINRHIVVVWQMVGVMTASVAALVFAQKNGVPASYAFILITIVSAWALEHIFDSNFWYNRNLVMITNIERVFLRERDLAYIHPYFAEHRKQHSFLAHLRIQRDYSYVVVAVSLVYFTLVDVLPSLDGSSSPDWRKIVAYAFAAGFAARAWYLTRKYDAKYRDYLKISPGIAISHNIDFGTTHGKQ